MDFSKSKCLELERSNVKVPAYKLRVYNETSPKVYSDLGRHQSRPFTRKSLRSRYFRP